METYLYLGRRDKKGVKVLTVFGSQNSPRIRVEDIKSLHLYPSLETSLEKTIYEHRFLWEVWIEGANNFEELKEKLKQRGYRNIPMHAEQTHPIKQNTIPYIKKSKNNTMLERNSKKLLPTPNTTLRNRKRTTINFNN